MDSRISARALAAALGQWRTREPAYEALADGIRLLSLDNRLAAQTLLPAERVLAQSLRVSRTTIASAYASLRDSGHIRSVRGSGSVTVATDRGDDGRVTTAVGAIDLQQASPAAWPGVAGVIAEVAIDATSLIGRTGYDTLGSSVLRGAIAERYAVRGLPTRPEEILVTTGAQSAISLLAQVLLSRGDRALVETPTYPHAADALRGAGARLVAVPVTTDAGWDLDRAEEALTRTSPRLAYLMPVFQNPTGRIMSSEEQARIARAAARSGTTLIVDETTAELHFDRAVPLSFPTGQVLRIGSLGKTAWGGLRVGWIRGEPELIRRLHAARPARDLGTPEFEQAVAAALLPRMPEILQQRGEALRAGHDALVAAFAARLPQWQVPHVVGGVALWVGLPSAASSALVLAARADGVYLTAGPRFAVDGGHDNRLRVPFTAAPADLERAVAVLGDAWDRVQAGLPSPLVPAGDALV